jgi:hypothetical protein
MFVVPLSYRNQRSFRVGAVDAPSINTTPVPASRLPAARPSSFVIFRVQRDPRVAGLLSKHSATGDIADEIHKYSYPCLLFRHWRAKPALIDLSVLSPQHQNFLRPRSV